MVQVQVPKLLCDTTQLGRKSDEYWLNNHGVTINGDSLESRKQSTEDNAEVFRPVRITHHRLRRSAEPIPFNGPSHIPAAASSMMHESVEELSTMSLRWRHD